MRKTRFDNRSVKRDINPSKINIIDSLSVPNISSLNNVTNDISKIGNIIFSKDDSKFYGFNGTEWLSFDSGSTPAQVV